MGNKKVCILTSVHLPFDGRIFHKEAKTLVKAGYDVVLIAQHNKEEIVDGVKIVPLPKPRNRFERITRVAWRLFRLALKEKADVYHFHDPELIPVGLTLKLLGKKVIYDIHELVYFQIGDKHWLKFPIVKRLIQWAYLLFENLSIKFFDQLILAEDGYQSYFAQRYRDFKRYTIIRNFPILELIDKTEPLNINKQKPIIIYAGGLTKIRGIKEIIRAMELVEDRVKLWLLGKWENKEFKNKCENLKGWKYTKYLGLNPLEEVYSYMEAADIGISILYPVKNYVTGLPVKAFEYMACSLPMVMSDFPYWRKIFGECALFADAYNPRDITEKILYLLDNPDKAKRLGRRGRELIEEKYSWEMEQGKLLQIYEKVLNK